jgi:hypothetical protein
MTAVSLISPYAPQPAGSPSMDATFSMAQASLPIKNTSASGDAGLASDQSGQGTGNGTGTGGAHLAVLLKRGRSEMPIQRPTPESVVEAQSGSDPATEFLKRQARQKIEAKASEEARAAERAAARAAEARIEADKAAEPEYVMPNPLPTAPILERDES